MVGSGVGILDPIQLALTYHGIRIGIELQKRGDLRHAFLHVPPNLNPAFGLEIGGEQYIDVGLRPGATSRTI
jgi:hypothetical protein